MARYDAGETLASIARTYDCSPPAISYVVSRSRGRNGGDAASKTPAPSEVQLVKASPGEPAATNGAIPPPANGVSGNGELGDPRLPRLDPPAVQSPREVNGFARNGGERSPSLPGLAAQPQRQPTPAPASAEHRPTLHLSLGNPSPANGAAAAAEPAGVRREEPPAQHHTGGETVAPPQPAPERWRGEVPEPRPAAYTAQVQRVDGERKEGGGAYIDKELRARVDGDITAFLAAFDAALSADTQESRAALRDATDRLLRAGARTRIELERLEARIPLPRRDGGRDEPAWRHR